MSNDDYGFANIEHGCVYAFILYYDMCFVFVFVCVCVD